MTMTTTMLLHLALVLAIPSYVSSFGSMSHVSLQGPLLGAVSTQQQRVPLTLLFGGKVDEDDEGNVNLSDVNISDVMNEVEEALKAAAEALSDLPPKGKGTQHSRREDRPSNVSEAGKINDGFRFFASHEKLGGEL
jgi:hypothetical protein